MPKKTVLKAAATPKTAVPVLLPQGLNFILKTNTDWELEKIDIKTLTDLQEDPYATAVFNKLTNLIFQDPYQIEIRDQNDNPQDTLTKQFQAMFDAPWVELWQTMKNTFGAWYWFGPFLGSRGIKFDGIYMPSEIRELPPETFSENNSEGTILAESRILKGICRLDDGKIHYFQRQEYDIEELENCFHIKPPGYSSDIGGLPLIYPLLKVFKKMGFAWLAQMQAVNRSGAGNILFIRVTNPVRSADGKRDDWKYVNNVLKNYGKNNLFPLYDNMEPIEVATNPSEVALKTIDLLAKVIIFQFSTSDLVSKEGTLIGGSNTAEKELQENFIRGFHTALINAYQPLVQDFLDFNGFQGYKAIITIPSPEFVNEEVNIKKAIEGRAAQNIHPNEHRKFLGLPPKSYEELTQIKNLWAIPTVEQQAYQAEQFQQQVAKAQAQGQAMNEDGVKRQVDEDKDKQKGEKGKFKGNKEDLPAREDIQKDLETDLENNIRSFFADIKKIKAV